jgi:hypothetical protein
LTACRLVGLHVGAITGALTRPTRCPCISSYAYTLRGPGGGVRGVQVDNSAQWLTLDTAKTKQTKKVSEIGPADQGEALLPPRGLFLFVCPDRQLSRLSRQLPRLSRQLPRLSRQLSRLSRQLSIAFLSNKKAPTKKDMHVRGASARGATRRLLSQAGPALMAATGATTTR